MGNPAIFPLIYHCDASDVLRAERWIGEAYGRIGHESTTDIMSYL